MMHQLWYVDGLTVPALLPGPAPHDARAMVCGFFDWPAPHIAENLLCLHVQFSRAWPLFPQLLLPRALTHPAAAYTARVFSGIRTTPKAQAGA
ncbi:hypothetical protein NDU88_004722 [Pleurodeles waltl]|uniref:Uncharacterized protein n=1 Tax=Pleurodeles waltl TaxID=8319 RepID=A0AAV7W5S7_PLEWA|nr:hypothetical protein NDU88_004722 [Pleurodeles waltl]